VSTPIIVPRLGVKVVEVTVLRWLVEDGAAVEAGQSILAVDTDKVEVEIEAPATGSLRASAVEGEVYEVGAALGEIE